MSMLVWLLQVALLATGIILGVCAAVSVIVAIVVGAMLILEAWKGRKELDK